MIDDNSKEFIARHIGPSEKDQIKIKNNSELNSLMSKTDYDKFVAESPS